MELEVGGEKVLAGTGGRPFDPALPVMVFLHGAGFDRTTWSLLARWFAHRGHAVLAPDLPGHGESRGKPLTSIAAMTGWTLALLDAVRARSATIVGHSMGSLVALETAARHPERVDALGLVCAAAAVPVSRDLLDAAAHDEAAAIGMMNVWGHGFRAGLGGSLAPGTWMMGGSRRVLQCCEPGVLFADLSACNDYRDGLAAAAKVRVPAVVVLGERDLMIPAQGGLELAAAMPDARVTVLKDAGHMLASERPDELLHALRPLARAPSAKAG